MASQYYRYVYDFASNFFVIEFDYIPDISPQFYNQFFRIRSDEIIILFS